MIYLTNQNLQNVLQKLKLDLIEQIEKWKQTKIKILQLKEKNTEQKKITLTLAKNHLEYEIQKIKDFILELKTNPSLLKNWLPPTAKKIYFKQLEKYLEKEKNGN